MALQHRARQCGPQRPGEPQPGRFGDGPGPVQEPIGAPPGCGADDDRDVAEPVPAERPGAALARAERARAVRRAIQALPPRQRATLILRTYHELPHQQIAQIFGTSVGAVKANFFHALGNLRKILGSEP